MKKFWIWDDKQFRQVKEDRLDFKWPYSPPNKAKFLIRKPNKWMYVSYGNERAECWDNKTEYERKYIEKLEKEVLKMKSDLLMKYGNREKGNK